MYKLSFTGDLMALLPENRVAFDGTKFDYTPVFSKISPVLKESDYVVGNLETPIGNEELGWTCEPTIFNTPKEFAYAAVEAGFTCFSLSNNHCLDRGIIGLEQTIVNLRNIGVDTLGVYNNIESAQKPLIKKIGNKKIAFLSFTYGTNSEWRNNKLKSEELFRVDLFREQNEFKDIKVNRKLQRIKEFIKQILPQSIRERIKPIVIPDCVRDEIGLKSESYFFDHLNRKVKKAKEEADFVIMLLHSGGQYNSEVGIYTRNVCKSLIELGCDMIVVNHPHCVLPYEYINGKLVLYALGNFCFTPNYGFYYKGVYADYSLIFNLYIEDDINKWRRSISVCKIIKEKSGHSVVYPLNELIQNSKGKKKKDLIADNSAVLKRFFKDNISLSPKVEKEYFF